MARRDVCARSAEAPAVAEDMLLRLAIPGDARHAQSGLFAHLMLGLCVCTRSDLNCAGRAGLADEEQPAAHEDGGEQPILDSAELLAHNTDEP